MDKASAADERRPYTYPIPVSPGLNVVVSGLFPLTDEEWAQFTHVLDVMRPGLTQPLRTPSVDVDHPDYGAERAS